MRNLERLPLGGSDKVIALELGKAGVEILNGVGGPGPVAYSTVGVLGARCDMTELRYHIEAFGAVLDAEELQKWFKFVFVRQPRYWLVQGAVPLPVARTLHRHEYGRQMWVMGQPDAPAPDERRGNGLYKWAQPYEGPHGGEGAAIEVYHIQTQPALNVFAYWLKESGLTKVPAQFSFGG